METELKKCVIPGCDTEFLIKTKGKRIPKNINSLKTGIRFRRKGCKTCSPKCSKKNLTLNAIKKREDKKNE